MREICLENQNDKFQENFSRPGIIDARARYRAADRRLRNTALADLTSIYGKYKHKSTKHILL